MAGSVKTNQRVLLVDDDQRILNFSRLKLMASGYDVITAMTGQGALTMIESQKPDILLLDLKMPGMGGLEVLTTLRASSQLPVIVISAATDLAEEALDSGVRYETSEILWDVAVSQIRPCAKAGQRNSKLDSLKWVESWF